MSNPQVEQSTPSPTQTAPTQGKGQHAKGVGALAVVALGIVYGDIGTSPLYAFQVALQNTKHTVATPGDALGIASLIIWSLIIIVAIKYCFLVLRADNKGEGGILALASQLMPTSRKSRILTTSTLLGIAGCGLMCGDGMITPAISVLSAMEGMKVITPSFAPVVVPATLAVLVGLFFIQRMGTARIGGSFGVVMVVWFAVLAAVGLYQIALHPTVLLALSPTYAWDTLIGAQTWMVSFAIVGAIFLALTGAEAMYADMGHVGAEAIRWTFLRIVLPSLILNYLGQAATVMGDPSAMDNPFYKALPSVMMVPMILLAGMATVIASQALISGLFSLARQTILMNLLPKMKVKQTNRDQYGQIYVPVINSGLAVGTMLVVLAFQTSDALAGAYGIAVSGTMLITTVLLYRVMVEKWGYPKSNALMIVAIFAALETLFLVSNSLKIFEGGWLPLLIGAALTFAMIAWWRGTQAVRRELERRSLTSIDAFGQILQHKGTARVPGLAVFMTKISENVPPVVLHHVENTGALHKNVVLFSVIVHPVPKVAAEEKLERQLLLKDGDNSIHRVFLHVGFMEIPRIEGAVFADLRGQIDEQELLRQHLFISSETVSHRKNSPLGWLTFIIYKLMKRNAALPTDFFGLRHPERTTQVVMPVEI